MIASWSGSCHLAFRIDDRAKAVVGYQCFCAAEEEGVSRIDSFDALQDEAVDHALKRLCLCQFGLTQDEGLGVAFGRTAFHPAQAC